MQFLAQPLPSPKTKEKFCVPLWFSAVNVNCTKKLYNYKSRHLKFLQRCFAGEQVPLTSETSGSYGFSKYTLLLIFSVCSATRKKKV